MVAIANALIGEVYVITDFTVTKETKQIGTFIGPYTEKKNKRKTKIMTVGSFPFTIG